VKNPVFLSLSYFYGLVALMRPGLPSMRTHLRVVLGGQGV
jgi:hypothetical protein